MQEASSVLATPTINDAKATHQGVCEDIRKTTDDEVVHRGPTIQEVGYGPDVTRCTRFSKGRQRHPGGLNLRDRPGHIHEYIRHQILATMVT
jgi:hypothetical protein